MKKLILTLALMLVSMTGCSLSNLDGEDAPPLRTIVNEKMVELNKQTLCWNTECTNVKIPDFPIDTTPVEAAPGSVIVLDLGTMWIEPSSASIREIGKSWNEINGKEIIKVPTEPGDYNYEVTTHWNNTNGESIGQAYYTLSFTVE